MTGSATSDSPLRSTPDPTFWAGKRVFVTGHTGFKGSWLSLWLEMLGADVTGYALEPPTSPSLFEQAGVSTCIRSIIADVRDAERLTAAVTRVRPDIVIHMAAQSVVKRGYVDPIETYASNVMGTVHLFEAVRRIERPCVVVNVTSDKCYAHGKSGEAFTETDPMGGDDPYSNSKGCAELVTTAWRASYFPPDRIHEHGVALGSARAGNAIGGGDWTADQLIPDLIRAFLAGRPCPIRRPNAIRPWQFVLEPLRGYLLLAERLHADGPAFASGWNFGPIASDERPVSWIADRLVSGWGDGASWCRDDAHHPPEAATLRLDASKARQVGWQPALGLADTLDWIIEWYHAWRRDADVSDVTRSQLTRYSKRVTG